MKRTVIILIPVAVLCLTGAFYWYLRSRPTNVDLANARIALDQGDPSQAARLARAVLQREPEAFDAYRVLVAAILRLSEYDNVRRMADRALQVRPDSTEPWAWKTRASRFEAIGRLQRLPQGAPPEDVGSVLKMLDATLGALTAASLPAADPAIELEKGLTYIAIAECHRILESRTLEQVNLATVAGRKADAERLGKEAASHAERVRAAEDRAIASLTVALNAPEPSADAGEQLQAVYDRRGAYDRVVEIYEQLEKAGRATERAALQAVGALVSAGANETGSRRQEFTLKAKRILARRIGENPDRDKDARVAMARLTLNDGNPTAAMQIAEEVLKKDPKHTQAQSLKGQVLLAQRKYEEAKQILQPLSTLYPNWIEVQYLMAIAQLETGFTGIAQQTLRRVLLLNPQYLIARLRLAESLWKSGQGNAADAELRDAVITSTSRETILPAVVSLSWQHGTAERAARLVDAALETGTPSPRLLEVAAGQYWRLGQIQKAQECLARAGATDAQSPTARLMRAGQLIEQSQPASAEAILVALQNDPTVAVEARVALAGLRYAQGRPLDARQILAETARMPDLTASHRIAIAEAYLNGGSLDEALAMVKEVLAKTPDSYTGRMLLGNVLMARGDTAGARSAYAAAEKLLPGEEIDPARLANLAFLRGDFKRCAQICDRALHAGSAPPSLRFLAARALEQLGKLDEAAAQLTTYIASMPDDPEGYVQLGELYARAKRPEDGIKAANSVKAARPALVRLAEGCILRATGRTEEAVERLSAVFMGLGSDLTPEARRAIAGTVALWQMSLGRVDQAVEAFDWLTDVKDEVAAAWGRFGIFVESARLHDARQELRKLEALLVAGSMKPTDYEKLARAQLNVGEPDTALETARRFAAAFPELSEPTRLAMEIQRRSGRFAEAIQTFNEAAGRRPNDVELLADGVKLCVAARDFLAADRALGLLSRAGATGAFRAGVLRGEMYMHLGLDVAAVAELRKLKEQAGGSEDTVQVALGAALASLGKLDESDAELRAVPPHAKRYVEALRLLAANAGRRNQPVAGLVFLDQALQREPDNESVAQEKIRLHLAADQVQPALALATGFARRSREPARRVEWMVALAQLQWLAGDVKASENTYRALSRAAPGDAGIRLQHAIFLLAADRDAEALALLTGALPTDRVDDLVRRGLRVLAGGPAAAAASGPTTGPVSVPNEFVPLALAACGDADSARQQLRNSPPRDLSHADLEKVVAAGTDDAGRRRIRRLLLARSMRTAGLRDVGLHAARKLAEEWADPIVLQTLREAFEAVDRKADAAQATERLVREHPGSATAKEALADAAFAEGRYDDAWRILNEVLGIEGETARLCIRLGLVLDRQGKPAEAIGRYRRAFELDPTFGSALNNEAYMMAATAGNDTAALDRAMELMKRVSALGPVTPAWLDTVGWIHVLRGDKEEGVRFLAAAIVDLRKEPVAHYHIGVAYKNAGRPDLAHLHLENVAHLAAGDLPELRLARELLSAMRLRGTTTAP